VKLNLRSWIIGSTLFLAFAAPRAQTNPSPGPIYTNTGYSTMMRLGKDLYRSLKPENQKIVSPEPIFIETDVTPFVKPVEYPDEPKPLRAVFISAGFIDLVNYVAHAKAIDKIQKGYFEKYVLSLSEETGEKELRELPDLSNRRFWTDDMLNAQRSYFNQIVGEVVAIELSHHYLGHYKKYASQLVDAQEKTVPINNLLTPQEWDASVQAGVRNALNCGLGIDGVKALYECIDKMPKRPAWTAFFLPANVKLSKLKKDLQRLEDRFFAGFE
jgi:hypothetical protein